MRDEDDDLLRAAEELGIDLSGVRATTSDAADEQAETTDDTDAGEPEEAPRAASRTPTWTQTQTSTSATSPPSTNEA